MIRLVRHFFLLPSKAAIIFFSCFCSGLILPFASFAEEVTSGVPTLDAGDTAWVLVATVLVLFMSIPGLALFYGGMVRTRNVLSVFAQCFVITALVSVLWLMYGYSLAIGGGTGGYLGDFSKFFLAGVTTESLTGTIPEMAFVAFQMMFAIITPALIIGAFVERIRFSALLWFVGLWFTFVYVPVCHWVWGEGGWLHDKNILDFAGGTVVHINAGIAGLVTAIMIGKRRGYPSVAMSPHNLTYTIIGASMLWVGWFGFNAGSALAANGTAAMALITTQISAAAAVLGWLSCEWIKHGKPSVLGIASGAISGLVAITPACGSVGLVGALFIGLLAGIGCFFAATTLKRKFNYDDALDVFGVHAVGGIIGSVLTGIFSATLFGGVGIAEDVGGIIGQLAVQILGVAVVVVYSGVVSFILFMAIDMLIGVRVSSDQEAEGLDIVSHDERGYSF